jgi:hypothetical protein
MSETTIILIEKDGTFTEKKVKTIEKLYTLCNYRNNNNFELLYTWKNDCDYELYGKRKGKSACENKAILPSPLQEEQFYGTLCLLKKVNNNYVNITLNEWKNIRVVDIEEKFVPDEKELTKEEYEDEL